MNRALLIGINAYPDAPLRGCVNDVTDMANFLVEHCNFKKAEIRMLVDKRATTKAILERLSWLVTGLKAGDRVLFHYSGHGAQIATRNPAGEIDGLDELICPVDFDWSDDLMIRDKDFVKIFGSVPAGVEFVWVSDSCHSGDLTRDIPPKGMRPKFMPQPVDVAWGVEVAKHLGVAKAVKPLNVALITGCRDDQESADAVFGNRFNGALTYYLLKELSKSGGKPMSEVVPAVVKALAKAKFDQEPQLEGAPGLRKHPFLAQSVPV